MKMRKFKPNIPKMKMPKSGFSMPKKGSIKIDKNSVKWKVMLPITMLGAMLLLCGILCLGQLKGMLRASQMISDRYAQNISKLGEIAEDFQSLHRVVYAHCLAEDKASMEELAVEASSLRSDIQGANIEYEEMMQSEKEKEQFQQFESDYEKYLASFEQAVRLSEKKRNDEAEDLANDTLSTLGKTISDEISDMLRATKRGWSRQSQSRRSSIIPLSLWW